jgi:hypothetical protein
MFGQSFFDAEGNQIKVGTYKKSYNFYYEIHDTLSLFFSDSIETFSNSDSTIVKSITYSKFEKQPHTRLEYFRTNKKDSISKHFIGDNLSCIYETRFDSLDRIVYYALKNFDPEQSYSDFEDTYEYRDSIANKEKFLIQAIYQKGNFGGKEFLRRDIMKYDDNGIPKYFYEYEFDNSEHNKQKNTKCWQESEKTFTVLNFNGIKSLIKQMLQENKKLLTTNRCENLIYTYVSPDKQTNLTIIKRKPYYCGGRSVIFSTVKKQ